MSLQLPQQHGVPQYVDTGNVNPSGLSEVVVIDSDTSGDLRVEDAVAPPLVAGLANTATSQSIPLSVDVEPELPIVIDDSVLGESPIAIDVSSTQNTILDVQILFWLSSLI